MWVTHTAVGVSSYPTAITGYNNHTLVLMCHNLNRRNQCPPQMERVWQTWSDYCCHYFQQINRLQDCSPCLTPLWSMTAQASNVKTHQGDLQKAHLRWLIHSKGCLLRCTISKETLSWGQLSRSARHVVTTCSRGLQRSWVSRRALESAACPFKPGSVTPLYQGFVPGSHGFPSITRESYMFLRGGGDWVLSIIILTA